jgi:hypothetical protein
MRSGKTRNAARSGVILIALILLVGFLVSSPRAAQSWKVASVNLAGADGANNNMAFAYDRYIMVAPYAPSKVPTDPAAVDQLDNYKIYLIDSKRPADDNVLAQALETPSDHKRLYYPTKVVYDEQSKTVYVRGTRYEAVDGGVMEIAAIAYMHLNLDGNAKPVFSDDLVMIDIAGVDDQKTTSDAPDDFALAFGGNVLVFTNGASIFTYNLDHGYLYSVDIVDAKAYSAGSRISYLDVDPVTNFLTVYWNGQVEQGGKVKNFTELSIYKLAQGGTMQLNKRLHGEQFPDGVFITPGSNAVVLTDASSKPASVLFVTSDGMLSQIEMTSDEVYSPLKPLFQFVSMAASGPDSSPRLIEYDPVKRTVGVVRQGYTAQIRKPINDRGGRRGSVIRALSLFSAVESPALALARFKNTSFKVVASKEYTDDFRDESGLTRLVNGRDSQWLLATHSGKVLALSTADAIETMAPTLLTQVGPRTGRVAYFDSRDSIVAITSFSLDSTEQEIDEAGTLVVARQSGASAQSLGVVSAATVLARRVAKAQGPTLGIRRPCNLSKP